MPAIPAAQCPADLEAHTFWADPDGTYYCAKCALRKTHEEFEQYGTRLGEIREALGRLPMIASLSGKPRATEAV